MMEERSRGRRRGWASRGGREWEWVEDDYGHGEEEKKAEQFAAKQREGHIPAERGKGKQEQEGR